MHWSWESKWEHRGDPRGLSESCHVPLAEVCKAPPAILDFASPFNPPAPFSVLRANSFYILQPVHSFSKYLLSPTMSKRHAKPWEYVTEQNRQKSMLSLKYLVVADFTTFFFSYVHSFLSLYISRIKSIYFTFSPLIQDFNYIRI